jgi:cytochrome c6
LINEVEKREFSLTHHLSFAFFVFWISHCFCSFRCIENGTVLVERANLSTAGLLAHVRGNHRGVLTMTRKIRPFVTLAVVLSLAGAVGFAQSSGEALYKAKCLMCHGAAGLADSPAGKAMKVKPITDPEVSKLSAAQMTDAVRNGMGKMQPYKDKLTDDQIKDAVSYFRTFLK